MKQSTEDPIAARAPREKQGNVRSKMKMIKSKDFEARYFIVHLFFSFEVLFFYHLLLKYLILPLMNNAIFCSNLALKKINPWCSLKSKIVTSCYPSTLLTWIINIIDMHG